MKHTVGEIYVISHGFFEGEKIIIDWISKNKNIFSNNNRYTQASGRLIDKKYKRINVILEFLKPQKKKYRDLSKMELIKKVKNGDKLAKLEFIRRYRKKPKF